MNDLLEKQVIWVTVTETQCEAPQWPHHLLCTNSW